MTLIALILSILLGTASLAMGYGQAGATAYPRWFLLLAVLWLLACLRKWYWFSSIALLVMIFAAGYGVWYGYATVWMLFGAVGGLLGWDLADFARRLSYAAPMDDTRSLERRHLERVALVAALGTALGLLTVFIHVRLAFEVAVILVLLAVLGLTRLVIGLRK